MMIIVVSYYYYTIYNFVCMFLLSNWWWWWKWVFVLKYFFFFSSSMKTFGCCLWNKTKRIYNWDWKFWTQNWFNQKDIKGCFFVSVVNLNSARNSYKLPIYIYTNYIDFGNQYIKSNIGNIKKKQVISRNYKDYQWCNL